MRALLRILLGVALTALLLAIGGTLILRGWTDARYRKRVFTVSNVPPRRVALVFGAGVWPDGTLSSILADRVQTAVELYQQGKVLKLLMSGDNRFVEYNEPQHMLEYAVARGVPRQDIVLDYAGRRTYDSCYRASYIFGVHDAILVTQSYHLDRALFTAQALGLDVVGVAADRRDYRYIQRYWWRELLATPVAWVEVMITHPMPVLGEKLPIFADTP